MCLWVRRLCYSYFLFFIPFPSLLFKSQRSNRANVSIPFFFSLSTGHRLSSLFLLVSSLALPHYDNSYPFSPLCFLRAAQKALGPPNPAANAANQGTPVGGRAQTGPTMHEVNNEPSRRRDEFRVKFTLRSQQRLLPQAPSDGAEPAITGCR